MTDEHEEPRSFGECQKELGEVVTSRAEVIAAMDCIMHHLRDEQDFSQWTQNAVKDENDWHILDWEDGEAKCRTKAYMDIARGMTTHEFECVCRTFASIIKGQCFSQSYYAGALDCGSFRADW